MKRQYKIYLSVIFFILALFFQSTYQINAWDCRRMSGTIDDQYNGRTSFQNAYGYENLIWEGYESAIQQGVNNF